MLHSAGSCCTQVLEEVAGLDVFDATICGATRQAYLLHESAWLQGAVDKTPALPWSLAQTIRHVPADAADASASGAMTAKVGAATAVIAPAATATAVRRGERRVAHLCAGGGCKLPPPFEFKRNLKPVGLSSNIDSE